MQDLNIVAEELFNKIRGRFPSITIGDEQGNVINDPQEARFFDFDFHAQGRAVGKVSISLDDTAVSIIYGKDILSNQDNITKQDWYNFLKELRMFARKRLLNFDVRDISKSSLDRRDYKFLAATKFKDSPMRETKMYGTSKTSYQDIGTARLVLKHQSPVNTEQAAGRTQRVGSIYIESAEGERFKYPHRHLAGARAMARHVSEGGKPYDEFGSHISEMSEELGKLRKFKTYMGRSSVMAESLSEYMGIVNERAQLIKKTMAQLQRENSYKQAFDSFEKPIFEQVPEDVSQNWIDQLTIRQFNEDLKDVFPYIYKLVGEATRAKEIGPDDIVDEAGKLSSGEEDPCWKGYKMTGTKDKGGKQVPNCVPESEFEAGLDSILGELDQYPASNEPDQESEDIQHEQQTPLGEFILSYYDSNSGEFPKGETAVLTMVEKSYGDRFIDPAKTFIEKINYTFEQYASNSAAADVTPADSDDSQEFDRMKHLAGL